MTICVKFPKGKQKRFLLMVKRKLNCSWDEIAKRLEIHRQTIFIYLNETSMISEKNFKKLCNLSNLKEDCFNFEKLEIRNTELKIKYPKLSKELSEFIGILAGDGHISKGKDYEISIVAHKILDKRLLENTCYNLFKNLFGLEPKLFHQKNIIKVRVYSKKLKEFLMNTYNLPTGKKKGKLKMPPPIKQNPIYLRSYLRGLFDTDGSFHRHHKNTACVEITSGDARFLKEVYLALISLGFGPSMSGKNLYIYDTFEINKFFTEIVK